MCKSWTRVADVLVLFEGHAAWLSKSWTRVADVLVLFEGHAAWLSKSWTRVADVLVLFEGHAAWLSKSWTRVADVADPQARGLCIVRNRHVAAVSYESDEQIPHGAILARKTAGQGLVSHAESALLSRLLGR